MNIIELPPGGSLGEQLADDFKENPPESGESGKEWKAQTPEEPVPPPLESKLLHVDSGNGSKTAS